MMTSMIIHPIRERKSDKVITEPLFIPSNVIELYEKENKENK